MRVDTSPDERIPMLLEFSRTLSSLKDPRGALGFIVDSMRRAFGPRGYVAMTTEGLAPGSYRIVRHLTYSGERIVGEEFPWDDDERYPVRSGGLLGEVVADTSPKIFHDLSLGGDPVLGATMGDVHSALAVPMFENGEPIRWTVIFKRETEGFTFDDLEQAILRINLIGSTISHATLSDNLKKADRIIQREVDQIADIQRSLLPPVMPDVPEISIAASYATYDRAGGDYYDIFPLEADPVDETFDRQRPWVFIIADASGHGPAAAVMTAMLHAVLRAFSWKGRSAAEILEILNTKLFHRRVGNTFVTAFVAIYDPGTGILRYANAGHPPPILKDTRSAAELRFLDDVGGLPLGILEHVASEEGAIEFVPGLTLVLYTDGIVDARNLLGDPFGAGRIESALADCNGQPNCVIGSVTGALRRHEAGRRPQDDQTLVAIHRVTATPER